MRPIVGIIMGSDSDFQVMKEASDILNYFQIPHEVTIVSAHRTPDRLFNYAKEAKDRGIRIIIAGAGGSAHLPGMAAALTSIPVIGVPVKSNALSGIDSLYSIVQMPSGVPVATVAINGAKNAGILAAQILAISDEKLFYSLEQYKNEMENMVMEKVKELEKDRDEKQSNLKC